MMADAERTWTPSRRGPRGNRPPDRRSETPRRVRHGIRLHGDLDELRRETIAGRWLEILERSFTAAAWQEGLEYARAGQIAQLSVGGGAVVAAVQGRRSQPYDTRIGIEPLAQEQWSRLVATLAGEAGMVAPLLTGEAPDGLLELSERRGTDLLPADSLHLEVSCTCDAPAPCKHAAAVGMVTAERLKREPLTIFDLRGLASHLLLDRLRQVRAIQAYGAASAHADPFIAESQAPVAPLEDVLEEYWRTGPVMASLQREPPAEYAPQALLRRLGPSPLPGKFPLVGLLASIYDSVATYALQVRDHAEQIEVQPAEDATSE